LKEYIGLDSTFRKPAQHFPRAGRLVQKLGTGGWGELKLMLRRAVVKLVDISLCTILRRDEAFLVLPIIRDSRQSDIYSSFVKHTNEYSLLWVQACLGLMIT
jgi:hypothetical protein